MRGKLAALAPILMILLLVGASAQQPFKFYVFGDQGCEPCHQLIDMIAEVYGPDAIIFCDTANPACDEVLNLLYLNLMPEFKDRITIPTVMVRAGGRVAAVSVGPLDPQFWYNLDQILKDITESQVYVLRPDDVVVVGEITPDFQDFLNGLASRIDALATGGGSPIPALKEGDYFWPNIGFTLFLVMVFAAILVLSLRERPRQEGGEG